MSEQEKRDSRDLATMLKDLPKEDRLQVQGVIAGMKLARKATLFPPKKKGSVQAWITCKFSITGKSP